MHFLNGLFGFVWGVLLLAGPWVVGIFLISRLIGNIKLLNQSVIDLQGRVKELEKESKN